MQESLADLTVVDLTRLLPGPFATEILADLGARVIKIEAVGTGDYARALPPLAGDVGFAFAATNRGKHSVAVDLKKPAGVDVVRRLAERADVLVESFRPGVLERLGLDPADLLEANPRLVVLRLSGYGQTGPMRDAVGHDLNYAALAGIVALTGSKERPFVPGIPVADHAGALYGVIGILAALRERDRTGRGRVLDISLFDAALGVNAMYLTRAAHSDPPQRGYAELTGGLPGYDLYPCRDGRFLALGALEAKFWNLLVDALDRLDWEDRALDQDVRADLAALFLTADADDWAERLTKAGVPATVALDAADVLEHPHAQARLRLGARGVAEAAPGSPLTHRAATARVPDLGEATDAVLAELGFDAAAIAALKASGAVA